jgi:hypothetical protein
MLVLLTGICGTGLLERRSMESSCARDKETGFRKQNLLHDLQLISVYIAMEVNDA